MGLIFPVLLESSLLICFMWVHFVVWSLRIFSFLVISVLQNWIMQVCFCFCRVQMKKIMMLSQSSNELNQCLECPNWKHRTEFISIRFQNLVRLKFKHLRTESKTAHPYTLALRKIHLCKHFIFAKILKITNKIASSRKLQEV